MGCIPFSPKKLIEKLSTPKTVKKSKKKEDEFPPFMNGNLTSTDTWDLGDWDRKSAYGDSISMTSMPSIAGNESILASSNQNSNQESSFSSLTTLPRTKKLVCSTPKEVLSPSGALPKPLFNDESPILASPQEKIFELKRFKSNQQVFGSEYREMIKNVDHPVPRNSYARNLAHPTHKPRQTELRKEEKCEKNFTFNEKKVTEFILSVIIALCQLLFAFNIFPANNFFVYYISMIIMGVFAVKFFQFEVFDFLLCVVALLFYTCYVWAVNISFNLDILVFYTLLVRNFCTVLKFSWL